MRQCLEIFKSLLKSLSHLGVPVNNPLLEMMIVPSMLLNVDGHY